MGNRSEEYNNQACIISIAEGRSWLQGPKCPDTQPLNLFFIGLADLVNYSPLPPPPPTKGKIVNKVQNSYMLNRSIPLYRGGGDSLQGTRGGGGGVTKISNVNFVCLFFSLH